MKIMSLIALSFAILGGAYASAADVRSCNDLFNPNDVSAGFQCVSSKGQTFTRVDLDAQGKGWKSASGLTWIESMDLNRQSYTAAVALCAKQGGVIPSKQQFEQGEADGFREIVPGLKVGSYWTSTANLESAALNPGMDLVYLFVSNANGYPTGDAYFYGLAKDYVLGADVVCVSGKNGTPPSSD